MTAKAPKLTQDAPGFTRHTDSEGMHTTCKTCGYRVTAAPPKNHNGAAWALFATRRVVAAMRRHLVAAHGGET